MLARVRTLSKRLIKKKCKKSILLVSHSTDKFLLIFKKVLNFLIDRDRIVMNSCFERLIPLSSSDDSYITHKLIKVRLRLGL